MKFTSKASMQRIHIRDEIMDYSAGFPRKVRPSIVAEFGFAGPEWRDEDGHVHVDITGGFFDSEEAQRRLGWDDAERVMCEEKILYGIDTNQYSGEVHVWEAVAPSAPWKTYDQTHHNQIVSIAKATGTADTALAYEKFTKNRASVVKELEAVLAEAEGSDELLTAV